MQPLVPRDRPFRPLFAILAVGSGLGALACSKSEPKPAPDSQPEATVEPAAEQTGPQPQRADIPRASEFHAVRIEHEPAVLGHLLVPNTRALIDAVRNRIAPLQMANGVSEQSLRALAGANLGPRSMVAQNVALDRPWGCVLLDPRTYEPPVTCIATYKGGVERLIKDLGPADRSPDDKGHAAQFTVDGAPLFVDALADQVVVSGHPGAFAAAKDHLGRMVARTKPLGDIEVVAFAAGLAEAFQPELDAAVSATEAQARQGNQPTGDAELDRLLKVWSDYEIRSAKRTGEQLRSLDQFSAGLSLNGSGLALDMAIFPRPDTDLAKGWRSSASEPVDPSLPGKLPKQSAAILSWSLNETGWLESPYTAEIVGLVADTHAALSGQSPEVARRAMTAYALENAALYTDQRVAALMRVGESAGGALLVVPVEGDPTRDRWLAWSQAFTPAAVMGRTQDRPITWAFEPGSYELEGVPVDRLKISLTDVARNRLRTNNQQALVEIERFLGGLFVNIDRLETNGFVFYVIAPKAERDHLAAAVAATKGTDPLGAVNALATVGSRTQGASMVVALDIARLIQWADGLNPGSSTTGGRPFGNDLADVLLWSRADAKDGTTDLHGLVDQRLLDQIRRTPM